MSFLIRMLEPLQTSEYWSKQGNPRPVFSITCAHCMVATYMVWPRGYPERPPGWVYQVCELDGRETSYLHCPACAHSDSELYQEFPF